MKQRLDYIDGLRGFASLLVVFAHSWIHTGLYKTPGTLYGLSLSNWLGFGALGVNLFMVISGFVLTYPLIRAEGWRDLNVRDFFVRRAVRILPPYYAAIFLSALAVWLMPQLYRLFGSKHTSVLSGLDPAVILAHASFTRNIIAGYNPNFPTVNGSFWSLELEIQFYLFFPLLILAARRWGVINVVGTTLLITAVWRMLVWEQIVPRKQFNQTLAWSWNGPGRLFEFGLGIFAAYIVVRHRERIRPHITLLLSLLVLWMTAAYIMIKISNLYPLVDIMVGIGFFLMLLSAATSGVSQRFFSWRPLVAVGAFSYSLYLVHDPIIRELYSWFPKRDGLSAVLTYTVGFSLLVTFVGYLFYLVVEKPAIAWGKRIARSQQQHTPPSPTIEQPVVASATEQHAAP